MRLETPLACLAAALPAFGLGLIVAGQEDGQDDLLPPGWRERQQLERDELTAALQGNWTLVEFNHATNDLSTVGIAGYLGVQADLLVFIVHTTEPAVDFFGEPRRFQAGVHHWRLSDDSKLQTASIIGHTNFRNGQLEFENQYTPREYQPIVDERELSLVRSDGSVLRFLKLDAQPFPEQAAEIIEAARAGLDPFEDR